MRLIPLMVGLSLVCGGEARAQARGGLGSFGEAGDIPGCILSDSFDSHPAYTVLPIDPKDDYSYFNLADGGYVEGDPGYGIVDNASAISSATYNGPVGGPDPMGERGGMLHVQRASLGEAPLESLEFRYSLSPRTWYFATPDRPLFITLDIYKGSHAEFNWLRHYGNIVNMTLFTGGYYLGEDQLSELAMVRGDPQLIEGAAFVGLIDSDNGAIYLGGKDIPEHGWYTIGMLITVDDQGGGRRSYWLQDRETRGENGSIISRTPMRTSGPFAGQRMFSEFSLGLEEGWMQLYPGTEDDPATLDVIEGYGLALRGPEPFAEAPFYEDSAANRVDILQVAPLHTYSRLAAGYDPTPAQVPGYQMADWWVDNYCMRGGKRWPPLNCLADFNVDGTVDASDLAEMLAQWGVPQSLPLYSNQYSLALDGNTVVDSNDLAVLLAMWGACP